MIATIWASLNRFAFIFLPLYEKLVRNLYFSLAYFQGKLTYTLLEAFCFEAIFDKMYSKNVNDTKYMEQFLQYVDQDTKKYKGAFKTKEQFLEAVKTDVFRNMQSDQELERTLTLYYGQNEKLLPFKIN